MKKETYLKYREEFLKQYSELPKNELGYVKLKDFNIRNFKKFIFLFSCDFIGCYYTNIISSINSKKYRVKNYESVSNIKIVRNDSMFDKYNHNGIFEHALEYYYR